jgi:polar amino acid transport system substrate-binding protein
MCFHGENGDLIGFDVDLAKEACKRLGVQVEFRPIAWNNKEFEITSGNIDMIWNGLDITEERKAYMIYSRPYMDNRQILMVRKGNDKNIHSEDDLAGKAVGTQAGSNSETYLDEKKDFKISFDKFITYNIIKEGFDMLNSGELDVLIIDEIAARYEIIKASEMYEIIDVTIGPATELGIGFGKENTVLRDKIQKVFDGMIEDGTAAQISEKWFQADIIKHPK